MHVTARDLTLAVGRRTLFSNLCFSWTGPALIAVIGPSGSGKSTLLAAVLGWVRPTHGTIEVRSAETWLVPQNAPMLDSRTARENLEVALLAARPSASDDTDIDAALATYHLDHCAHTRAMHLSGGERQRIALARASLRKPELLLADEVTAGLDPASVTHVTTALQEIARRSLVVIATHDRRVWEVADATVDLASVQA